MKKIAACALLACVTATFLSNPAQGSETTPLPGTVLAGNRVEMELGVLESGVPVECSAGCGICGKGCGVDILLRPDDVVHDDASPVKARVLHKAFRGAEILYTLELASGERVLSLVPSHHDHALGEAIGIRLDVDHVVAFRSEPALQA